MEFLQQIGITDIKAALLIIANLILIESLLSVDNAAVMASMVMDLPKEQRAKALRIGMVFAYIFRGLALIFASVLMSIWWLKLLGGAYLVFIGYEYFKTKATPQKSDDILNKDGNFIFKYVSKFAGPFWGTVCMVELMDLTFSLDNVFAAVAFTDNIYLVCTGVFIGILTLRLVSVYFVKLMEKYPGLEKMAFIIILILGVKLSLSSLCHVMPVNTFCEIIESHTFEMIMSAVSLILFLIPIVGGRKKAV